MEQMASSIQDFLSCLRSLYSSNEEDILTSNTIRIAARQFRKQLNVDDMALLNFVTRKIAEEAGMLNMKNITVYIRFSSLEDDVKIAVGDSPQQQTVLFLKNESTGAFEMIWEKQWTTRKCLKKIHEVDLSSALKTALMLVPALLAITGRKDGKSPSSSS